MRRYAQRELGELVDPAQPELGQEHEDLSDANRVPTKITTTTKTGPLRSIRSNGGKP